MYRGLGITDAAKRMAGIINILASANDTPTLMRSWIAIRLSDGGWDGTTYDSRQDAIAHQSDERLCMYQHLLHCTGGMTEQQADALLSFYRKVYDAGYRISDPTQPEMVLPIGRETMAALAAAAQQVSGFSNERYR